MYDMSTGERSLYAKTSSIRPVRLTELRLVTDAQTNVRTHDHSHYQTTTASRAGKIIYSHYTV